MNPMSFKRLFCAAAVAAASLGTLPAQAGYSGVVVFGDSLSDSGNNYLALGPQTAPNPPITPNSDITSNFFVPALPYLGAPIPVYSNGPVWATSFAAALGLNALPSLAGGSNYAFGGAVTGGSSGFPFSLTDQVGMFLGGSGGVAPGSFLYVIAGGGNNARAALTGIAANPANTFAIVGAAAYQYATDVGNMVDALQAAGAQHIVVWNTPNLGTAPALFNQGPAVAGLASSVAQAMNGALDLRLSTEVGVTTFDVFGQVAGVIANPAAYGLSNVTGACLLGACAASEYLFWDGIHPSARGHQILAQAMLAQVVPEPETYLMLALGLAALAWRRRAA